MLAKVKEQDGIMLANVKVPSIPTSATCCDDVQLTNAESSCTTVNYIIGLRPPKHRYLSVVTCMYLQLSTTSSDCVLQAQIPLVIYNCQLLHRTASSSSKHRYLSLVIYNHQLLHRTASSFKPLM